MPRYAVVSKRRVYGGNAERRQKIVGVLKKINDFLRKTKAISRVANALSSRGVPIAGTVGNIASQLGYGRTRIRSNTCTRTVTRTRGGGLNLAGRPRGRGVRTAGGRRRRTTRRTTRR